MYIIQDTETGRFVTSDSIFITKDEIAYTSYTGEDDGIEYYYILDKAQKTIHKLNSILEKYGINKVFAIIETERKYIQEGSMIKEYFTKKN